jgi:hypothetical protein
MRRLNKKITIAPYENGVSILSCLDVSIVYLFIACFYAALFFPGCSGSQRSDESYFQLNLNRPEISGRTVVVNGGVVAQVERIEWNWGDGHTLKHHFFPASHTYTSPGTYEIMVKAVGRKGRTCAESIKVEIK